MASTYTLISSQVLASSASSVTFSSIPATYTDLVLRVSYQGYSGTANNGRLGIYFNGDTSLKYSTTELDGSGSAASSASQANTSNIRSGLGTVDYATYGNGSNIFNNIEIYIPNYTNTSSKQISIFGVGENNATASAIVANAGLYTGTSAITNIVLQDTSAGFSPNSSFYLYGISNA